MKIINTVHPDDFKTYQTSLIKGRSLLDELAQPGKIISHIYNTTA